MASSFTIRAVDRRPTGIKVTVDFDIEGEIFSDVLRFTHAQEMTREHVVGTIRERAESYRELHNDDPGGFVDNVANPHRKRYPLQSVAKTYNRRR